MKRGVRVISMRQDQTWETAPPISPTAENRQDPLWIEASRKKIEVLLREKSQKKFIVTITNNRHTMLSLRSKDGRPEARLHNMFLGAPDAVLLALARYLHNRDALSSQMLDEYIKNNTHLIDRSRRGDAPLPTKGEHVDLLEIFHDLNRRFFGGSVTAEITWGRSTSGQYRSSIKLGSYSLEEKLIRIHPALDQKAVPRYFVEWIVYHEMLHHVVPIPVKGNRRCFHSDEFRAREKLFPEYERASRWEQDNLHLLLHY
jgi:hypothetical protein